MSEHLLEVKNLQTNFRTGGGIVQAVRGVDLYVDAGEFLGIIGESGCGKSVTMMSILHLLEDNAAVRAETIKFNGVNLQEQSKKQIRKLLGSQIGMIFQDPMTSLNPVLTIGSQLTEGIMLHEGISYEEARQEAIRLLDRVGIRNAKDRLDSYPHEFSGGMRQRVMIAMALICKPKLLFADEPATALDVTIQAQILELLADLRKEYGMAIIMISHDLGVIASLCDRVCVMYAGRIVEEGSARQVFYQPAHPYAQGLLKSLPRLDSDRSEPLPVIAGQPPDLLLDIKGCSFLPRCPYAMIVCHENLPEQVMLEGGHSCWCWKSYKEQEEVASDE